MRPAGLCECTGRCGQQHRTCPAPLSVVTPRGGPDRSMVLVGWCRDCWAALLARTAADAATTNDT